MATLDLKPLSKETIEEMGYSDHDLWVVRVDEDLFGPFEAESLKHYAKENESLFENADACRLDSNDWSPFYHIHEFKNIEHMVDENKGPFWILINGLKSEPLSFQEIEKRIELKSLTIIDAVSVNDGHTWKKIFQIQCFSHHGQSSNILPSRPMGVASKLPTPTQKYTAGEQLAALMFMQGKSKSVTTVDLDELDLKSLEHKPMSFSLKLLLPIAAAAIAGIILMISFFYRKEMSSPIEISETVTPATINKRYNTSANILKAQDNRPIRMPANSSHDARSELTQSSMMHQTEYIDHTVEHSNNYQPDYNSGNEPMPEPERDPANDGQSENNLVNPAPEGVPLEDTMNQATQSPVPEEIAHPVEEAGDF